MIWGLVTRVPVMFDVLRDRNPTFVRLHDGSIRNGFTLKVANLSFQRETYQVSLTGLENATLKTPGMDATQGPLSVAVAPNQVVPLRVLVSAPPAALATPSLPVAFHLTRRQGESRRRISVPLRSREPPMNPATTSALSQAPTRPAFTLKGWHVLVGMLLFFGADIAVNTVFMMDAYRTYPGEGSQTPYEDGLAYNQRA